MELPMKSKLVIFSLLTFWMFMGNFSFAQKGHDSISKIRETYNDTLGKRDSLDDENDSLQKWKHSREFTYMNYLDSLLRKKTGLKADTVSIDEATGKVKRPQKKSADYSGLNKFLNSFPLKIFFWLLAIIFISFIFYKIFLKNGIFKRRIKQPGEKEDENFLSGLDESSKYDSLIHEAESKNDFNLSTRFWYLKTLKNLSDKELIYFSPDKTNNEYVQEMESNMHQKLFASLTRNYEYVWYGKFIIDKIKYEQLKSEFILFNKKV